MSFLKYFLIGALLGGWILSQTSAQTPQYPFATAAGYTGSAFIPVSVTSTGQLNVISK